MMTIDSLEFLSRFLLHVLPRGLVRIRSFGFLANRRRATLLPLCQRLLADQPMPHPSADTTSPTQPTCFRCPKCSTHPPPTAGAPAFYPDRREGPAGSR